LRRSLSLAFVCAFFALVTLAQAQTVDIAVGGNTLWSPKNTTASTGFIPPPEKGGVYPSFSAQYVSGASPFGINAEGAFRYHETIYNDFQPYRPWLFDVNGVYTSRLANKTRGDFMAGVGAQRVLFYNSGNCLIPTGGCRVNFNTTHFLVHFGVGIRYSVWRNIFIRPEAHWYYIPNNVEFHSNNVFRVGASVGYTFGNHPAKAKPAAQEKPAPPQPQPQPEPPK